MTSPAELIAEAIDNTCDVDYALSYRPARLDARMAFVAPGDPWKQPDESFCGMSIGLSVFLVAGSAEPVEALAWLDAQSDLLLELARIDVEVDVVAILQVNPPFLFTTGDGGSYLACEVELSRYSTGD